MIYKGDRIVFGGKVVRYYQGKSGIVLDTFREDGEDLAKIQLDDGSIVNACIEDCE